MSLELIDFFCGAGGSSQGATAIPGVTARLAANHWARAIESHALNFPDTEHFQGDLHDADVEKFPAGDIFWASPECPTWSQARGKRRDYDKQPDLFGETLPDEATDRSRSLMWDVPRYLAAMQLRGRPILAGVVENVTDVRAWTLWREWVSAIEKLGYRTRLIAINSMHARPKLTPWAPQSRDRLYLALTQAGDCRAATDRMRFAPGRDFTGLSEEAAVTLAPGNDAQDHAAAVATADWTLRHGCAGPGGACEPRTHAAHLAAALEDLRALGLAPDPMAGKATNDLGIRKQERRKPRAEGPGAAV